MTSLAAETAMTSARHCAQPSLPAVRRPRRGAGLLATLVAILCLPVMQAPALGASPAEMRGQFFARTNCAGCHSIDKVTASPLKLAPPFRELGAFYPASDLQEAFAEGVVTAHPAMPEFQFTPQEIADLIAYLDSISGSPSNSPP